jgi:LuxR family transcriptional regulator, maltose regulon positive regulatory protein
MIGAEVTRPVAPGFPALPPGWMARGRLHDALTLGMERTLTTVTGPPGAGKTVLLSGWAQGAAPGPVAWLSLDELDNDPSWFWRHLAAAVHRIDVSLTALVGEMGTRSRERNPRHTETPVMLTTVSTSLPVVIIVDDVHLLTAPDVIEAASSLVDHLPAHVRLVLSGRFCPPLRFEALRVGEQLFQIPPADLAFTTEEAIDLFSSPHTSPLPIETVTALAQRTEGWAAGLRMADLMFAECGSSSALLDQVAGHARLMAGYFDRELLDTQTADRVQFLLATSVLDELTAEGCALVTGRDDAGTLLHVLGQEQVLVERLDSPIPSYRYHPLFLEFLRYKLHRDAPAIARRSHLRAATWSEARGDEQAAVRHLIAAGSHADALARGVLGVVRDLDGCYLPGDAALAVTELPEQYISQDPLRRYLAAAAHLGQLRLAEAARHLRALERTSRGHPEGPLLQERAELLWTLRDGLLADPAGVLRHSERATVLLTSARASGSDHSRSSGPDWADAMDGVLRRRMPALAAAAHLWLDDPGAAQGVLDRTSRGESSADPDDLIVRAGVAYAEGRLDDASGLAERALDPARRPDRSGGLSTVNGLLTLAGVHYERNEMEAATERLEEVHRLCAATSLGHWRAAAGCEQAQTLVAQGRLTDALDGLRHLRQQEIGDPLPPHLVRRLDHVEIRCRLALGDLDGAVRLLQSSAPGGWSIGARARLDLAAGRPDRAARRLGSHDSARLRPGAEIERLLLFARAHLQLGDQRRADVGVRGAVEEGRPSRFIRLFVDEGPELLGTLQAAARRSPDPYLAEVLSHIIGARIRPQAGSAEVLEPFTDREREVLGYLPSHLAQHEIATAMYISLNTVKTHTKAVYRKLGAGSRSQAVDLARAHGLI